MQDLYQNLLQKIKAQNPDNYQFKPIQHQIDINQKMSRTNVQSQLQIVKKDNRNQLDKQIYNIAQNIVFNFFSLSNQKFYAIILRCKYWGLNICVQQFIMHYYLFIKTNNKLRQFIMLHFNKIASIACSIIQMQLVTKINLQSFNTDKTEEKMLHQNLAQKQKQILDTIPQDEIKKKVVQPVKSEDDAAKLKQQILADLKASNKEIQAL